MELPTNQNEFLESCQELRKIALTFSDPLVVFHHDADGVSSGAIAVSALAKNSKTGKTPRYKCIKKLDDEAIDSLMQEKEIIFTDLGGGNPRVNELKDVLIIDHHQTKGIEKMQANPQLHGIDGADELSGSSTAYCVFRERVDLAIVGAVGDMQSPLRGMNRWVLEQGVESGEVKIENDLRFYGRYCRPLVQFLAFSDDPYIPMVSYNEDRATKLLTDLGIKTQDNMRLRVYAELDDEEKRRLISEIANILVNSDLVKKASELIGESYVFPNHARDETYEANDFSTLLNACGRHGRSEIGLRVCLNDSSAFDEARILLSTHRKMIRDGISFANGNIQDMGPFYFLDARGIIDESIIGTVCGMAMRATWTKPIIGISNGERNAAGRKESAVNSQPRRGEGQEDPQTGEGVSPSAVRNDIKISSRSPRALVNAGLNLAAVMKAGTEEVNGIGGGHKIAAGASIPNGKINEFLLKIGKELRQKT